MEIGCRAPRARFRWKAVRVLSGTASSGHSVRVEDYLGRVESERARQGLLRKIAEYHRRAVLAFTRRRTRVVRMIGPAVHTSV